MEVRVVRASQVAALLAPSPQGDAAACAFGKMFEEEFTSAMWRGVYDVGTFLRGLPLGVDERGRARAAGIFQCFVAAGLRGRKPKTRFRCLTDRFYVAAQPDLVIEDWIYDVHVEFKTYALDD
jgi:hypothetical protein